MYMVRVEKTDKDFMASSKIYQIFGNPDQTPYEEGSSKGHLLYMGKGKSCTVITHSLTFKDLGVAEKITI